MTAAGSSRGLDGVRQLLEPWFRELAGARISGEIPITEVRLNQWIRDRLQRSEGPIEEAMVRLRAANHIIVRLRFRRPPFAPALTITARIEEQPSLPDAPVFVLRWSMPGMGPLAKLIGPALALFKAPPPGVVVEGDRIVMNVEQFLREHGGGDVFTNLTTLRVETGDNTLLVSFGLHISSPESK